MTDDKNKSNIPDNNTQKDKDVLPSWAENAKEDLEDFIEEQGIYIRQ